MLDHGISRRLMQVKRNDARNACTTASKVISPSDVCSPSLRSAASPRAFAKNINKINYLYNRLFSTRE
jgi:hypothetical protein